MSNATDYTTALRYNYVSQEITKCGGIPLYFLCLFGTGMNILTFMRQTYNSGPCSFYLLIASYFDLIYLHIGSLSNILMYGFQYDLSMPSGTFCKIKNYIVFVVSVLSATLTTMASVDRYILSCRDSSRWKYSTRSIAVCITKYIVLFWIIASIPIVFCFTHFAHSSSNEQLICSIPSRHSIYFFIYFVYICIVNGFLHPIITLIFGVLTCSNIRHLRQRSLIKSSRVEQINYQLTSMVVLQLIKSSFTSLPISTLNCYLLIARNKHKSRLDEARENLVYQIFYLLFWSNYTSFFVYAYSSDIFRKQWIRAMKNMVYPLCREKLGHRLSCRPETKRLTVS